ncbi:phosphohydrolase [Mycobacterium sp.]|uniref:phosphohydrolase n=1 Tax=Mycobacterium sp. TaxID=1785 RepID=UPI002CD7E069|nr:phosphohydrolase [Mycobacterium sp.]HTQ18411.1 phosphohydrolase [Mycobacterium sp.]
MAVTLDWDWATRTDGNLSPQEYRYLVGVLLRDLPSAVAGMMRYRFGRRGTGRTDLIGLPVPDSTLARRAEEFVQQELSAHVLAHSYRTYYFGKVLAAQDGVTVDDEIAYLTALLHDLQLEHPTPGRCFALTGAERTAQLLADWGADDSTTKTVAAAACAHATPGVDHDLADPAGFVLAGSLADIIGRRLDDIEPSWLEDLQQRYPRHGLKQHLVAALRAEAKAVPRGRMCLANRWASVPLLVRIAPYPE